jgi:hypothetical protein
MTEESKESFDNDKYSMPQIFEIGTTASLCPYTMVETDFEQEFIGDHSMAPVGNDQQEIVDSLEPDDMDEIFSAITDDFRSSIGGLDVEYIVDDLFVDAQFSPFHTSANQMVLFPK